MLSWKINIVRCEVDAHIMRDFRYSERIWSKLPPRLILSLGLIGVTIIFTILIASDLTIERQFFTALFMATFACLELVEYWLYGDNSPPKVGVLLLFLRGALAYGAILFSNFSLAFLLYALLPFNAFFVFGSHVSNVLAVFYSIVSFIQQPDILDLPVADPLPGWITQQIVTIFLLLLARVLQREKEHQYYTEKLLRHLQISHRELQVYAAQVAELATAEERNRLARDIHDSVGHHLTAVNIQLEKALVFRKHDLDQSFQAVRDAKQAAQEALRDVRESVAGLREMDSSLRLKSSLETLTNQVSTNRLPVEFQFAGDESDYNRMVLLTLYRAAQEGLTNIQKHAHATCVRLEVELGSQQAHMSLTDNGNGFDASALASFQESNSSYGLRGIRERVELLRGQVRIDSVPEQGTTLIVTIPKNPITLPTGV